MQINKTKVLREEEVTGSRDIEHSAMLTPNHGSIECISAREGGGAKNLRNRELRGVSKEAAAAVHEERGQSGAKSALHNPHPRNVRNLIQHQHLHHRHEQHANVHFPLPKKHHHVQHHFKDCQTQRKHAMCAI